MLIMSVFMILAGVFLAFYPEATASLVCNLVGSIIIIVGIANIIHYFMMDVQVAFYRNDFIYGLLAFILGVIIIWRKEFFINLIPVIMGIIILGSGISKLQDGIDTARLGHPQGKISILLSSISIIAGIFVMIYKFVSLRSMFIIIGICLIYCGLSDLFNTIYLSTRIVEFKRKLTKEGTLNTAIDMIEHKN